MRGTPLASIDRRVDGGGDVSRPFGGHADAVGHLTSQLVVERDGCVVRLAGELDLASRDDAMRSCLDVGGLVVFVDLRGLTFMDCGGYGGLLAARVELERRGGSLTLTGAAGEPARLLDLLGVT